MGGNVYVASPPSVVASSPLRQLENYTNMKPPPMLKKPSTERIVVMGLHSSYGIDR